MAGRVAQVSGAGGGADGQLVSHVDARIDRMGPSVIAATGELCEVIDAARGRARRSCASGRAAGQSPVGALSEDASRSSS